MAASTVRDLPPGCAYKPSGLQIIAQYLVPRALRGELRDGAVPGCYVVEGVDVFSASPDELPFQPSYGEVRGYFFAARPAGDARPAPGGCWVPYGPEKGYQHGGEVVAFRRRFAFLAARVGGGDGRQTWAPTRWLMKEYRLNKGAAAFRRTQPDHPRASMDCVVRKVFTKPGVPPPPPSSSSEEEILPASSYPAGMDDEAGYSRDEDQERKRVGYSIEGPARKRARST